MSHATEDQEPNRDIDDSTPIDADGGVWRQVSSALGVFCESDFKFIAKEGAPWE